MKSLFIFFIFLLPLFGAAPTVLVTGGTGYIGTQTCKALAEAGYLPIAYDINCKNERKKWGPYVQGNVLDVEHLKKVCKEFQPICVIHFAALMSVPESVKDPFSYYLNNFLGTLALLKAMKASGVENLIFSSTACLYGNRTIFPLKETLLITDPPNPYARSKLFAEICIKEWAENNPLQYVIFRYFNAAGADAEEGMGQLLEESHHLLTTCLKASLTDKKISIFGSDFPTLDGTAVRDYVHVKDLADAHVKAVSYLVKGGSSEIINLGTGKGLSVKEVVDCVQKVTQIPLQISWVERREGDVPILIADIEKAGEILKWQPRHSSIETIVRSAWLFTQKQKATL